MINHWRKFTVYKNGFTLSEVLITLVIIGIVAAATIPTLINNTKKNEFVAGLKKANSVLSQAILKIGQSKGYPVGDYSFLQNIDFADEFVKVVNVNKKCNNFAECSGKNLSQYKFTNGNSVSGVNDSGKSVITSDGQLFSFLSIGIISFGTYGISSEDSDNRLVRILVDLNGPKNPNKFGYDTFIFYVINNKGIIPAGSASYSNCASWSSGETCAARVLKENAINY